MPIPAETAVSLDLMAPNSVHGVAHSQIKRHHPLGKVPAAGQAVVSGLGEPGSGRHQQVVGDDADPYVLLESAPSGPVQRSRPKARFSVEIPASIPARTLRSIL